MIKMSNPNKINGYCIITHPISGQLKIINNEELNKYNDGLLEKYPWILKHTNYTRKQMIYMQFIGDLYYAKYKLFKHKIEQIEFDKEYYTKWNTKPNHTHSQKYYERYYSVLQSFDRHIEKLTKLTTKYENENPYMML